MELKHLRLETNPEGWHKLWIDAQGRKLNVLFEELFDELRLVVDTLRSTQDHRPVVMCSAKDKGFVVGADLKRILSIQSDTEIQGFLKHGQDVLDAWERLPNLTIAWIRGPCLGGGLELAMACRHRIVNNSIETSLGMPESKLGLTPGWGGTQRLMRWVGLRNAIPMLLGGEPIDAPRAIQWGLADGSWIDTEAIDAQMKTWIARLAQSANTERFSEQANLQEWNSSETWLAEQLQIGIQPQDNAMRKARTQILRCVEFGVLEGSQRGQRCEREGFFELLSSPECQAILARFSQPKKNS